MPESLSELERRRDGLYERVKALGDFRRVLATTNSGTILTVVSPLLILPFDSAF